MPTRSPFAALVSLAFLSALGPAPALAQAAPPKTPESKAAPVSTDAPAVVVPKPAVPLRPGKFTYRVTMSLAGQAREMTVTTEIVDDPGGWAITDTATTPGSGGTPAGTVTDRGLVDKSTLQLKRRTLQQGPNTIDYDVKGGKAVGQFLVSGQAHPFSVELGGGLFNDGPGVYQTMATLPFAPGYVTAYRSFDVQVQRVQTVRLRVVATGSVTVPAGTFDAFEVDLTGSDDGAKTTVWVDKLSRKVVKFVGVRPQLRGATLTSELVK